MDDPLFKENFISTKEASELSGYNADYIGSVCRAGKVECKQIGRQWYINRHSLSSYMVEQEARKKEIAEELSRVRLEEYRGTKHPLLPQFQGAMSRAPMATTALAFVVLLSASVGSYALFANQTNENLLSGESASLTASPLSAISDIFSNAISELAFLLHPQNLTVYQSQVPMLVKSSASSTPTFRTVSVPHVSNTYQLTGITPAYLEARLALVSQDVVGRLSKLVILHQSPSVSGGSSSTVDLTNISGSTITNSTFSGTSVTTTLLTATNGIFSTASTSEATTTYLYVGSAIRGAGLASCSASTDKLLWNSATGQFTCGVDAGASGSGISGLHAQYSVTQGGATQTLATSSDTNLGLTITSSGDVHTFTPVWIGTLAAGRGGTGLSSLTNNQILIGGPGNTVTQIATSSLGLLTTNVAEGNNLYFTNTRFDNRLSATTSLPNITTLAGLTSVSTSLTGLLKAAAGTLAAAIAGVDYVAGGPGAATTTVSASGPLSLTSNPVVFGASPITLSITQATTGASGYLSSTDFNTFNNKISSSSLSAGTGISYNSTTGVITNTIGYPFPSNATTTGLGLYASTTIGAGGAQTGLTVSGNSTTTGAAYIGGDLTLSRSAAPTQGSVSFGNTGTNALTFDGSNFHFSGTGAVFTDSSAFIAQANSSSLGIGAKYNPGTGSVYFGATNSATPDAVFSNTAGLERARITDAGNLGIGTTSPFAKLSVAGDTYVGGSLTATGTITFIGLGSGLVKSTNGVLSNAVAGTDYANFAYLFPGNATTTLINFLGGASTTAISANTAAFGATATSSFASNGTLTLAQALTVPNGGTGSTTLGGLLSGAGTGAVTSASVSAPLTFSGNTLSISQATAGTNGYLSSSDWSLFNNKISSSSLSAVFPLAYNSSTGAFTYGGLSTSTAAVVGNIPYFSSANTFANVATTSLAVSGPLNVTGTLGALVGGSASTITYYGLATTSALVSGNLLYGSGVNGVANVATTTETLGGEFSYSGTLGSLVGGSSGTLTLANAGVALTKLAQIAANSVLVNNTGSTGNVVAIATSTFFGTGSGGQVLTWNNGVPSWIATTTYAAGAGISTTFANGQLTIANTGLLSLQQTGGGSAQTGAITFATSSASFNGHTLGLNITNSAGAFTFTPTLSGTLNVQGGGTGITSVADGALVMGSSATALTSLATSTGGTILQTSFTTGRPSYVATSTLGIALADTTGTLGVSRGGTATTTFYNGGVIFSDGTKLTQAANSGNNIFFWDNTNGRLGIGSTSPNTALVVNGTTTVQSGTIYVSPSQAEIDDNFSIGARSTSGTNGAGINIFPGGTIDLYLSNAIRTRFSNGAIGTGDSIGIGSSAVSPDVFLNRSSTGDLTFNTVTSTGEKARLTKLGLFGIGTTSPYSGQLTIASTTGSQLSLADGSLSSSPFNFRAINNSLYISTSSPSTFATTTTPFFVLNSSTGSTTLLKLDVTGTATSSLGAGINLATGCFAILGTCVGGGSGTNFFTNSGASTYLSTGSNLGIGTTTPWAQLSINPTATNGTTPAFAVGSSTNSVFTISNAGYTGIGTSTPYHQLEIVASGIPNTDAGIFATYYGTGNTRLTMRRANGTVAAPTAVAAGDRLYVMNGAGYDGTTYVTGAQILADVEAGATVSTNVVPAFLGFYTMNSSGTLAERARISSAGNLGLASTTPWAQLSVNPTAANGTAPQFVVGSSSATNLIVTNAGLVGIGTAAPTNRFSVVNVSAAAAAYISSSYSSGSGDIAYFANSASGGSTLVIGAGATGATLPSGVVALGNSSFGNQVFLNSSGNVGIGSTSPWAQLSVNPVAANGTGPQFVIGSSSATSFIVTNAGSIGIGTTSPWRPLSLSATVANAQFAVAYDATRYAQFQVDSTGDLIVDAQGADIRNNDDNLWVCAGGSCPTGAPSGNGSIIAETGIGLGSSTPWAGLSVVSGKAIVVGENTLATSTSMTVDWRNGNQQLVRLGFSATTISFTGYVDGQKLVLTVCNPGGTAGALSWGTQVLWSGGTAPTQTTTASKCDVWSFLATQATSTLKILGTQTANF